MFGLNPNNDSDASSDFDQDGMSALSGVPGLGNRPYESTVQTAMG